MIRLLGFVFRIAIVIAVALWLADRPGTARIVWHDYVIESSAAFLGLCVFIIAFIFYLVFRLWHLIVHGPERWRLHRKLQKMRRGQEQLTKGLIAIAGGDAAEAGRFAVGARKLLGTTTATHLLQAQAAQLAGDHGAAREIFQALAADPASAVLGYRGLIMDARREGRWADVESLVDKLRAVRPDTPWLNLIRFELLARRREWIEAGAVLDRVAMARLLEPARTKQYRAAVLIAQSHNEARQGLAAKALQTAEQAVRPVPGWLPAVINLAQRQMAAGHRRAAHRTIEKNWAQTPHPQLAAVYRGEHEDPLEAYKYTEHLCRGNEDNPVSRLALADAALAADVWGEARRHLIGLVSRNQATQGVYRLLARLERRESGNEKAALSWLMKAAEAAPDPAWLCHACGGTHDEWQATCRHCGSFNTIAWKSVGQIVDERRPIVELPAIGM